MVTLTGNIEDIVFYNQENGYGVLLVNCQEEPITVVGTFPELVVGEEVEVTGEFAHHMHSTRERWRVTAVDGAGNKSAPTGWAEYTRSVATTRVVAPPTPATTAPPTTPPTPSPTLETVTSTITVTTVVSSTLPTITIPSITVPTVTTLRPLPTTTTIFVKK